MIDDPISVKGKRRVRRPVFVLAGVALLLVAFWRPIQQEIMVQLFLRTETPSETLFAEFTERRNPAPILKRVWVSGKIAHRQKVVELLKTQAFAKPDWFEQMEPILIEAAEDPDASVRELALAALFTAKHPELPRLAARQLSDPDPQLRLLGLQYLRSSGAAAVPLAIQLLDDPDLRVVTSADAALRKWTGNDFGLRIAQSIPKRNSAGEEELDPEDLNLITEGVEKWKIWRAEHGAEHEGDLLTSVSGSRPPKRLPVSDFSLEDLNGNRVRLSQYRGKIVWLNFWTTWCAACLAEIPDLVQLQEKYSEELVILGISLDGLPDSHGHEHGHDHNHEHGHEHHEHGHEHAEPDQRLSEMEKIRTKVNRMARKLGINYPMLLDPSGKVGARFNGGELPTNVLIDADGFARRRFIGSRSPPVLDAMIQEVRRERMP
jgi:thiol-disulfide isomerase/thioredoxin